MPRSLLPVLLLAALAGCSTPAAVTTLDAGPAAATFEAGPDPDEGMTFGAQVPIDRLTQASEPSLAYAPDGTLWVAAPSLAVNLLATAGATPSQSLLWRSDDGGATFETIGEGPLGDKGEYDGGGDADVAVDPSGRIYVVDLDDGLPVLVSEDGGASWRITYAGIADAGHDRPWIVTGAPGDAWVVFTASHRYFRSGVFVAATHDGGATWGEPVRLGEWHAPAGVPSFDLERGRLYVPFLGADGLHVATSSDGGASFTTSRVTALLPEDLLSFVTSAVDAGGHLHLAWSRDVGYGAAVFHAWASPGAATWSEPVSPIAGIMPWIVAGDEGRVAIAYLAGAPIPSGATRPDDAYAGSWSIEVLYSSEARADSPKFYRQFPTGTIHRGTVCTNGLGCTLGPAFGRPDMLADRSLGDFFEATITPEGRLALAFTRDDPAPAAHVSPTFLAQTDGFLLRQPR